MCRCSWLNEYKWHASLQSLVQIQIRIQYKTKHSEIYTDLDSRQMDSNLMYVCSVAKNLSVLKSCFSLRKQASGQTRTPVSAWTDHTVPKLIYLWVKLIEFFIWFLLSRICSLIVVASGRRHFRLMWTKQRAVQEQLPVNIWFSH